MDPSMQELLGVLMLVSFPLGLILYAMSRSARAQREKLEHEEKNRE